MCNPSRSYLPIFLQGCEIKSGRVRPGFEAKLEIRQPSAVIVSNWASVSVSKPPLS